MWFLDTWVSYSEFHEYVLKFATALYKLGVRKGDVVALHLPNSIQYVVSYYAVIRIGAIVSGVNPTYKPIEILHQLQVIKPKVLIALDYLYKDNIKPIINKSSVEKVIYTNIADLAHGLGIKRILGKIIKKIPTGKVDFPGALKFIDLLQIESNLPKVDLDVKVDPATYIMTGGTTGLPKAAILTHFNIYANAYQSKLWLGGEEPELGNIGVMPFFHSFAHTVVMNATIVFGGWMLIFPKPPSTEEIVEHIEKLATKRGFVYVGAEVLFKRLAEFKEMHKYPGVMGKLILCISGAGTLHKSVRDAFVKNTNGNLVEGYGLTEASPVVCAGNLFGESPVGVIGLPYPGMEWGIWPIDDFSKGPICLGNPEDVNYGEEHIGELCIHGPQMMLEYLNQPEETRSVFREFKGKLWLLTGDIGFMNKDGTVVLKDRKKELIKVKGYSVFPKEVEELIMTHPEISEVAIAGIPHESFGEVIKAWIKLIPESKITLDEIKDWINKNITHFKRPYYIDIINDIPKNLIGKVQRRILQINDPIYREKYGEPQEQDKI